MWIWGNETIDLVLPRHSNWDTTSETSVLLGVLLVYVPSVRTFGALFPLSLWPVSFTNPWNLLFRVATWIPVCLLISLWLSFPSWYISQAVIISSSVHFWSCWFLCTELGFHLILWTSFLFFAGCFGACFFPFFSLTWMQKKKFFQMSCLMSRLRGGGAHVLLEQITGSYNRFVDTRMRMQGLCLFLT